MRLSQKNENSQGTKNRQSAQTTRPQTPNNSLKFPKKARILSSKHYQVVLRAGNKLMGKTVIVDYRLGKSFCPKLGITVSKKYGKAHERNRFKRVVREAFRITYPEFPRDLEINILPRIPTRPPSRQAILEDLNLLLKKIYVEPRTEKSS